MKKSFLLIAAAITLVACQGKPAAPAAEAVEPTETTEEVQVEVITDSIAVEAEQIEELPATEEAPATEETPVTEESAN